MLPLHRDRSRKEEGDGCSAEYNTEDRGFFGCPFAHRDMLRQVNFRKQITLVDAVPPTVRAHETQAKDMLNTERPESKE